MGKIYRQKKLDTKLVKKLMSKLYELGIEHIKSPSFNELGGFLDGDAASVKIYCDYVKSELSFYCVTPQTKINKDTPFNIKHFIKIIKFINRKINLEDNSKEMRRKLPKGKYCYFEGNGLSVFNVK